MLNVKNITVNSRRRNQTWKIYQVPHRISKTFIQYTGNNPDFKFSVQTNFGASKTSIFRQKLNSTFHENFTSRIVLSVPDVAQ